MNSAKWISVCVVTGIVGILLGLLGANASRAVDRASLRSEDGSVAALQAALKAHAAMPDGARVAEKTDHTFWPDGKESPGLGWDFERASEPEGQTRMAFASYDCSQIRLEPSEGGAPASMFALATIHEAILSRAGFMLVNANGWSTHWDDPRADKGPKFEVTRSRVEPGGGGQGGYYFRVGADSMVQVRTYAGSTHDCVVTIRQEFDARTKTLNVETYFSHAGDPSTPIRLIMTETGKVSP
jgi:hypothetical protein